MMTELLLVRKLGRPSWWRICRRAALSSSAAPTSVFSKRTFESVEGISAPTSVALYDEFNFRYMTHVQAAAIPAALSGEDLFVR